MFKILLVLFTFGLTVEISAQSITGFNLNYEYDPDAEISFKTQPVRQGDEVRIYFDFKCNRSEFAVSDYIFEWEKRTSVNDRSGESIKTSETVISEDSRHRSGILTVQASEKNWFAVVSITNKTNKGVWNFYSVVERNWPLEFILYESGGPIFSNYINTGMTYRVADSKPGQKLYGYLYKGTFNAAAPPFAKSGSDDRFLKADSSFVISDGSFNPKDQGLYLIQSDTTSANGLSVFAAPSPFPKYNTIQGLASPLIYLTTSDEQAKLMQVGNDKSGFDKIIVEMVGDAGRARTFMRSYYQRVENANKLFTGFKEGWKTDMGMIYMIFGVPSEVSRTTAYEIWYYKGTGSKFIFSRSGSVFAPITYFLTRNEDYTQDWYSTIDLWRKSRF
jgi:GWxTD domain-containing protein